MVLDTFVILLPDLQIAERLSPSTLISRMFLEMKVRVRYGISLAHNGNLINCDELREKLLYSLRCINTTSVVHSSFL